MFSKKFKKKTIRKMDSKTLKHFIFCDLYSYHGIATFSSLIKELMFGIGFKYSFWMRISAYLRSKPFVCFPAFILSRLFLRRYMMKYAIDIPYVTDIGPGFYIGHFSGIIIGGHTTIGTYCHVSQGVTIGASQRGKRKGSPTVGDRVYIGPGAKIFGNIRIGNDVAIGANCVVTKDIPDNAVVVGVPGEVISYNGSAGYLCYTNYT